MHVYGVYYSMCIFYRVSGCKYMVYIEEYTLKVIGLQYIKIHVYIMQDTLFHDYIVHCRRCTVAAGQEVQEEPEPSSSAGAVVSGTGRLYCLLCKLLQCTV